MAYPEGSRYPDDFSQALNKRLFLEEYVKKHRPQVKFILSSSIITNNPVTTNRKLPVDLTF